MAFTDFSGFGNALGQTYNSGPQDGNYSSGGVGGPSTQSSAVTVAVIVILAIVLLVTGVIGLRASGEVVI